MHERKIEDNAVIFYKACPDCDGISYQAGAGHSWFCPYCSRDLRRLYTFMLELECGGPF